jgi:LAS superfamily LD-carboxypeptidase LdcB
VNGLELTGRARTHVVAVETSGALHKNAVAPFLALCRAARAAGFELRAISSFRDFDRQLIIWNAKYNGERALLDDAGRPLEPLGMAPQERIEAILRWSALPGASRHHWGTDLDLIDVRAIPPDYSVQLIPAEFQPGGPFAAAFDWLQAHAARFGFFRPFRGELSGVGAEPWHFSFAPEAMNARRDLSPGVLREALETAPLAGKETVLAQLPQLHARYVAAIDWP